MAITVRPLPYSSSSIEVRRMSVVAPMVMRVGQTDTVLVAQYLIHVEGACIAGSITEYVLQLSALVALHSDDTMLGVHTGIHRLYRLIDIGTSYIASKHIIAHLQRYHLTIVEHILHHDDTSQFTFGLLGVGLRFLTRALHLTGAQSYAKLLVAVGTYKHQLLTGLITGFVEYYIIVALGTTYPLHVIYRISGECSEFQYPYRLKLCIFCS